MGRKSQESSWRCHPFSPKETGPWVSYSDCIMGETFMIYLYAGVIAVGLRSNRNSQMIQTAPRFSLRGPCSIQRTGRRNIGNCAMVAIVMDA